MSMIIIFHMFIKISMQMQAFDDPECISRFIKCLQLHWNLNYQLNYYDENLQMEGITLKIIFHNLSHCEVVLCKDFQFGQVWNFVTCLLLQ